MLISSKGYCSFDGFFQSHGIEQRYLFKPYFDDYEPSSITQHWQALMYYGCRIFNIDGQNHPLKFVGFSSRNATDEIETDDTGALCATSCIMNQYAMELADITGRPYAYSRSLI